MGYKIFVSYKYHDASVYPLHNSFNSFYFGGLNTTTARDYVDTLESYFDDHTSNIYKGESDNEDLSYLSDDAIWEKLKDRIYDSSVTIVLISPRMKEPYRSEKSQWIPWEIAYSLRETTRGDRTSHSNAVLAVVLPDRSHRYDYFIHPFSYQQADGQWHNGSDNVFSIIRKNMNNRWGYDSSFFSSKGIYPISANDESYIPSVTWDEFVKQPAYFIDTSVNRKEHIHDYHIVTEIGNDFYRRFF